MFTNKDPRWISNPISAFNEFVESDEYLYLGKRRPAGASTGRPHPLRKKSITVLCAMFGKFVRFVQEQGVTLDKVDAGHITAFLDRHTRVSAKRTGTSRIRVKYVQVLDRVFQHIGANPNPARAKALDNYAKPGAGGINAAREALTEEQAAAFMAALPGGPTASWKRRRDGAMLALILGAGLLPSEAISLETGDIAVIPATGDVRINVRQAAAGNMSGDHVTILHDFARPVVLAWVEERKGMRITGRYGRSLFPAREDGGRLNKATLYRHAQETFARANLPVSHQGCRTLRNSFIERELAGGTALETLQQYLGLHETKSVALYQDRTAARRRARRVAAPKMA